MDDTCMVAHPRLGEIRSTFVELSVWGAQSVFSEYVVGHTRTAGRDRWLISVGTVSHAANTRGHQRPTIIGHDKENFVLSWGSPSPVSWKQNCRSAMELSDSVESPLLKMMCL
jgi:hypothetical protein